MGLHNHYRGSLRPAGTVCASATEEESDPLTKNDGYSVLAPPRRCQVGLQVDRHEANFSSIEDALHRAHGHMPHLLCKFCIWDPVHDAGSIPNRLWRNQRMGAGH